MPPPDSAQSLPLWGLILASYLLGALPFGLLLAKGLKGIDPRTVGSGNIGATNTIRAVGKPIGLTAFALDVMKGLAPALWLAPLAAAEPDLVRAQVLGGAAAVIGHCFPVYLGFKGGKGVATACGAAIAVDPIVFLIGGAAWLICLATTRYVGLASMVMGVAFPIAAWARGDDAWFLGGTAALAALILLRHRANLGRLLRGEEPRMGDKKRDAASNGTDTSHA
tara:strand:+ start:3241 stop:3909 length:669 start_codon:yes stop_codon:yes gene_type:complete